MVKKILIIDDDEDLCEELIEILADEGMQAICAFDSRQAEALLNQDRYDCIILDFKIPGSNGIELLKKIKAKDAGVPVFLITGRPFLEKLLEQENAAHLVRGFMNKPFDVEELLTLLKQI